MSIWNAVGAIGGALLGALGQKDANDDNRANSEAFAQHGIRWRVADAKAAGLHPLYALGGASAIPASNAQSIFAGQDMAAMGQNVARAAVGASGHERSMQLAQLRVLEAQADKDEALASAARSEAARAQQDMLASKPITPPVAQSYPVRMPGQPQGNNLGEINPDGSWITPQPTPLGHWQNVPAYLAGAARPGFREFEFPGLGKVLLPDAENMAEALESLENTVNQAVVLAANLEHRPEFRRPDLLRRLMGVLSRQSRGRGLPPAILSPEGN